MTKTIFRSMTPKRRTARPKSKSAGSASAPYAGMLARLTTASMTLSAARRWR